MNRYSIRKLWVIKGRKVFFDANVLIYIFWPTGSFSSEKHYSSAFAGLKRQGNGLYTDFVVLSEIVNRVIRIEYEKHLRTTAISRENLTFKNFRNSGSGQTSLQDLSAIIEDNILGYFHITEQVHSKNNISSYLQDYNLDFCDQAIVSICKTNDCVLLTHDKDFQNTEIDILTNNNALLAP